MPEYEQKIWQEYLEDNMIIDFECCQISNNTMKKISQKLTLH